MALLAALRRILNDTAGTATDIDFNFQALESHVNTENINRDGSVAMTAPLVGVPAVNQNEYATLAQISGASGVIPISTTVDYGGDTAPPGWVLCDGAAYSSTDPTYDNLFAVIGYKFGDAGGGNFRVPDYRRKVPVGAGSGLSVGDTGGVADGFLPEHAHGPGNHTHSIAEQTHAAHLHSIDHNHPSDNVVFSGALRSSTHLFQAGSNSIVTYNASGNLITATVNLPNLVGNSGGTTVDAHPATDTGTPSTGVGDGTDSAGDPDITDKNYPPYVVMHRIMYIG